MLLNKVLIKDVICVIINLECSIDVWGVLMSIYNIYCDENCHLEYDKSDIMVLGAIMCPKELVHQISKDIEV